MCTALSLLTAPAHPGSGHLFGRTLDVERPYGAQVVILPRRAPLPRAHAPQAAVHHALIGAAAVHRGQPLFFEAANEHGLCIAALHFPGFAAYHAPRADRLCLAPFEVIPYVLGRCRSAQEARALLGGAVIADTPFAPDAPNTPLHWLVADAASCFAAEPLADGLLLTDDPARTLTNSPPLPQQLTRLADFMALSPDPPANRFAPDVPLEPYSLGMGAFGLPGDWSSSSRFVRTAFLARHGALAEDGAPDPVAHFFHLLGSAAQPFGATRTEEGEIEYTHYLSCIDAHAGVYHYRTYGSARIGAVRLRDHALEGEALLAAPMACDAAPLFARAQAL